MPRISEKTYVISALKNIWLADALTTILASDDRTESIIQHFTESPVARMPGLHVEGRGCGRQVGQGIVGGIVGAVGEAMGSDDVGGMEENMRVVLEAAQGGEEEEMIGVVELLCLLVPGVRYLAPRERIPRSEFLFHHHVC